MEQRGAVLFQGKRRWLVWDASVQPPVCLPIQEQGRRRSRWDYRLQEGDVPGLAGRALMVCGAEAIAVETRNAVLIGTMTVAGVAAVAVTMRRAAESEAIEARHRL